ncbi:MAG: hypothetical protein KatS3mg031_1197 [Chitinophagales bacterium]|nr:MAG: hypothetical protein KatS3mg031_1197 [Chitinophagales bacterium]
MNNLPSKRKPFKDYIKYSGLAFQFLAAILLGFLVGNWLDKYLKMSRPVFTIVFSLFCMVASLVLVIRDLTGKK